MRNGLSKLQYLLLALLLFALTGCGANSLNSAGSGQPGTITAKLVVAKQLAKKFENYSAGTATKTRLKVTGAQISTASAVFPSTTGGTISVYPGSELIITAEALDASGKVVYEGFATGVTVMSGGSVTVNIDLNYPVIKAENVTCQACHDTTRDASGQNLVADYKQSGHYANTVWAISPARNGALMAGCAGCHGTEHNVADPALGGRCNTCHNAVSAVAHNGAASTSMESVGFVNNCNSCHNAHNTNAFIGAGCTICHAVGQDAGSNKYVQDNSGVRSITQEFNKWSHHVTGVTLNNAHCAACHLEGKVNAAGAVVVDPDKHMVDAKTHLRNADTDADMLWDPAAPSHTTMDNFCMSCHDADGATSTMSLKIQAFISNNGLTAAGNIAGPLNPFGDTISNQYDKMLRGRVVNAANQFTTTNASHHAVRGKAYSGRVRSGTSRVIASPSTFAAVSSATYPGERKTLFEAGRFVSTYTTLADAAGEPTGHNGGQTLGDDSTLHCGDCHTVGQWKAGSAKNGDGSATTVAIGAHGSANEYLLRNSNGTDALHRGAKYNYGPANMASGTPAPYYMYSTAAGRYAGGSQFAGVKADGTPSRLANQAVSAAEVPASAPFLICYNCHVYTEYASVYFSNTAQGGREGSHAEGDHTRGNYCNGPYNTAGSGRATTWTAVYGQQVAGATGTFQGITNFNFGRLQPGAANNRIDGTADTAATWKNQGGSDDDTLLTQGTGNITIVLLSDGSTAAVGTKRPLTATRLLYNGMNGTSAGGGNAFQLQCASCHNSGPNNGFGGIHGSKINTYTDAKGTVQNARRFLPGLGNVGFVPGDTTGSEAQKWEQEAGATGPGCYTLSTSTSSTARELANPTTPEAGGTLNPGSGQMFGTWGSCTDHGAGVGTATGDRFDRTVIRPITY